MAKLLKILDDSEPESPLKTAAEMFAPDMAAEHGTPLKTAQEMTSGDLLRKMEQQRDKLRLAAVKAAGEFDSVSRSHAGRQTACAKKVDHLARVILERKWFREEAALTIGPSDLELLADLMLQHHVEKDTYTLSRTRNGEPHHVQMPVTRNLESFASRAGERAWILLADFAGRQFRAQAGALRVAQLDAEIIELVAQIKAAVAEDGWPVEDMIANSCCCALPVEGDRLAVQPEEIRAALEAAR